MSKKRGPNLFDRTLDNSIAALILIFSVSVYLLGFALVLRNMPTFKAYSPVMGTRLEEPRPTDKIDPKREDPSIVSETPNPIDAYISRMTLEEKIGQMIMGGVHSNERFNEQILFAKETGLGGIILMGSSVSDAAATISTSAKLDALQKETKIPLLVAIDEEGGIVTRLGDQLSNQTPQYNIKTTLAAYEIGLKKGNELVRIGINTNFAPVMDHSVLSSSFLYERSFRLPKQKAAEIGIAMIKGYSDSGIIAVPKHYPGHPDNITDSHEEIPISNTTREQFNEYAQQFRLLALNDSADMIMTGHILFPEIDNIISSLSEIMIGDILREEYGYEGVLITDDMNMGAMTGNYSTGEAAVKAVKAGNDILLYVTDTEIQRAAYNALITAVKNDEIPMTRIDQSVNRILILKSKYLGFDVEPTP